MVPPLGISPAASRGGPSGGSFKTTVMALISFPVALLNNRTARSLFFQAVSLARLLSALFLFPVNCPKIPHYKHKMSMSQLRSTGRLAQIAGHVKPARQFSTMPALRKEIKDAYILSAARTPTAKVRFIYNCVACFNC